VFSAIQEGVFMISIKLTGELEHRIDGIVQNTGQSPSAFVQRAIVAYLESIKEPSIVRKPNQSNNKRCLGEAKGLVFIKSDFDELPDEFMAHFS